MMLRQNVHIVYNTIILSLEYLKLAVYSECRPAFCSAPKWCLLLCWLSIQQMRNKGRSQALQIASVSWVQELKPAYQLLHMTNTSLHSPLLIQTLQIPRYQDPIYVKDWQIHDNCYRIPLSIIYPKIYAYNKMICSTIL